MSPLDQKVNKSLKVACTMKCDREKNYTQRKRERETTNTALLYELVFMVM